jgi:hypothetical protein
MKRREPWRSLEKAFSLTAFWSFAIFWALKLWFWTNAPRTQDPSIGAEVPIHGNGSVFYITQGQDVLITVLLSVSIATFGCAVVIDAYFDPFEWRKRQRVFNSPDDPQKNRASLYEATHRQWEGLPARAERLVECTRVLTVLNSSPISPGHRRTTP